MNKWFASARDLSDSESSGDSSEEDNKKTQQQQVAAGAKKGAAPGRRNYMKGFDESSESEEEQRTIKTQKDKKLESINAVIKDVNNHIKIKDFSSLMTDFEKFCEELERDINSNSYIIYQQGKDGVLPIQYLRVLVKIEDAINDAQNAEKDKKQKLNKTNSVSLNKLKQKMKKYLPAQGPQDNNLEIQIAKFRENPIWSEDERKAVKQQQKAKQEEQKAAAKKEETKKPTKAAKDDEDEDEEEDEEEYESEYDDEDEEDKDESEEEEEIDIFKIPREQMTPAQRRLKWVKKDRLPLYLQQQLGIKKETKQKEVTEQKKIDKEAGEAKVNQINAAMATTEKEAKETILNLKTDYQQIDFSKGDNVVKQIKSLQDERMKGKFDPRYHSTVFTYMLSQVKETKQKVEITLNLLNSLFDFAKITSTGYMGRETWLITYDHLQSLMQLLDTSLIRESLKNHLTKELVRQQSEVNKEEGADDEVEPIATQSEIEKSILPSLANFIEKLDHELLKAFQNIAHTRIEYLQRIRDENKLLFLCDQVQSYLQEFNDYGKAARVAIIKLDHIYYKNDSMYQKMRAAKSDNDNKPYIIENSRQFLNDLVSIINSHGTSKLKVRAALYVVYHLSIHNNFYEAKDLLLKTHISDIVHLQDIGTQIIYNRTITQIGMAAFRGGLIEEAHDILVDICQSLKLREILGQGFSRLADKPIELEKEELKRQVPFHMHINLHQLDCIYIITAMLLEIPNIAENQFIVNKKIISKNFKKLIDQYDSKAFYLAAENYRDNLVLAAKSLNKSDWKSAVDQVFSIKLITKMPEFNNDGQNQFKDNLILRFKEASLKAFLCRSAQNYKSFSVSSLSKQFEIDETQLFRIISRMIVRNKIQAHFDSSKTLLILDSQSSEMKELQQLSLQYVDKLEAMVENNERLIDMIAGGNLYQYKERTATEISVINANKRQKLNLKAFGGVPNVGQQTYNVIIQNPSQRR